MTIITQYTPIQKAAYARKMRNSRGSRRQTYKKSYVPRGPKSNQIITTRNIRVQVAEQSGAPSVGNFYFQVSQIPDISSLAAVFQKFKLLRVECTWMPRANVGTLVGGAAITNAVVAYAFNPNNLTTGSPTYTTISQMQGVKIGSIYEQHLIVIYPVIKNQVGEAGLVTYYTNMYVSKTWLDLTNSGVQMYGLDFVVPQTGSAVGTIIGQWELNYVLCFKNTI